MNTIVVIAHHWAMELQVLAQNTAQPKPTNTN